jgi:hypothetical protein
VSPPTLREQLRRQRVETLIGLAAPALDLVLGIGDRVSRIVGPEDEYYPIRAPGEAFELPTRRPEPPSD